MIDFFDEIRERLEMPTVAAFYGHTPNRGAFILCPFHNEDTPSLKLYKHSFHCFGCASHGDAVAFVQRLFCLSSATEAARRLNDDFHLGLPMDGTSFHVPRERKRREEVALARRRFEAWRKETLDALTLAFRTASFAFMKIKETGSMDSLTDAEVLSIQWLSTVENRLDILLHGELSEQMKLFMKRGEIKILCNQILNGSQTK